MPRRTSRRASAERPSSSSEDPRQKARYLLELAFNDGAAEAERSSALVKAGMLIRKHDLLTLPKSPFEGLSNNKTVKAAKTVAETLSNPEFVGSMKEITNGIGELLRRSRR